MSSKFLHSTDLNVSDGSTQIVGSSLSATNLSASLPLKTNSASVIYSTLLDIADVSGLSTSLAGALLIDGTNAMTAPVRAVDGLTNLPAYTFDSDLTSGVCLNTFGDLSLCDSGVEAIKCAGANVTIKGSLTMDTNRIEELGAPVSADDAATKEYVDNASATKLTKDGSDFMTGDLDMGGFAVYNTGLVSGVDLPILETTVGTNTTNIGNNATAITGKLNLSGGTMSGDLKMGTNDISGVGDVYTGLGSKIIFPVNSNLDITNDSLVSYIKLDDVFETIFIGKPVNLLSNKLYGGNSAGDNLTLESTSNVSKGQIDCLDALHMNNKDIVSANDIDCNGNLQIDGNIDQSMGGGALVLGPTNASSVDIGASTIDTNILGDLTVAGEIKGDLVVGGYIEPTFSTNATYLNSTITKTGRSFISTTNTGARWAISTDTFNAGVDTVDRKLFVKVNSVTGSWNCAFGLYNKATVISTTSITPDNIYTYVGTGVTTLQNSIVDAGGLGGSFGVNNTGTQSFSNNDIMELRVTDVCQNFYVYYHGAVITDSPTLILSWTGMTANDIRFIIGDSAGDSSAFDVETVAYSDLVVSGVIDSKITEPLQIGPTTASSVDIGSATIPTNILGNMTCIDILSTHTAVGNNEHGIEIDYNANGFADGQALDINYETGALTAGAQDDAILISIDKTDSTGGEIVGLAVLTVDGSADAYGLECGVQVNPLLHLAGGFVDATFAEVEGVDELTDIKNSGADTNIFVADDDTLDIGYTSTFNEIEFILTTGSSGGGIAPTFWYQTTGPVWTEFFPQDSTNGFRLTGVLAWVDADVPGWVADAGDYKIRIIRTKNSLNTTPVLALAKVSDATQYGWDKSADLTCNTVDATTSYSVAGTKILGTQGAAVADASDAATAISQLNLLLARCRAHGIIAT